jgi:membrane protein insertase Oxa1/YidC/SpoIIIJ
MLNGLFELISGLLNFFYELVPDYGVAIALLTCTVMLVTTPLTLKSTRSMIEMQRLQPEIRKLQVQYKDDRQKLNEEMMAFYKANEINPLGGCLPMLAPRSRRRARCPGVRAPPSGSPASFRGRGPRARPPPARAGQPSR